MKKFRWAVLGTGYISNIFADGMSYVPEALKSAVCAISIDDANAYADKHGFEQRFDDFDKMLNEATIDVVYIAVPNMLHFEFVMKALDAGKHVLCEKPMADNSKQLHAMVIKAKEKNVFLMEGLWTRCFPAMKKVREWIDTDRVGKIRSVRSNFGLKANEDWQGWKAKSEFAGGAIRDVGIYTLAMAFAGFKGEAPTEVISTVVKKFDADYHSELLLKYADNRTAYLTNSFDLVTDYKTVFYGDKGSIVCGKVWNPDYAELFSFEDGDEFTSTSVEVFNDIHPSQGMQYEIQHIHECLLNGARESDLFSLSESITICSIIDEFRKKWDIKYSSDDF